MAIPMSTMPATPGLLMPGSAGSMMSSSSPGLPTPAGSGYRQDVQMQSSPANYNNYASMKPYPQLQPGQYVAHNMQRAKSQQDLYSVHPGLNRSNSCQPMMMPTFDQQQQHNGLAPYPMDRRALSAEPPSEYYPPMPEQNGRKNSRANSRAFEAANGSGIGLGLGFASSPGKQAMDINQLMQFASPRTRAAMDNFLRSQTVEDLRPMQQRQIFSSNEANTQFVSRHVFVLHGIQTNLRSRLRSITIGNSSRKPLLNSLELSSHRLLFSKTEGRGRLLLKLQTFESMISLKALKQIILLPHRLLSQSPLLVAPLPYVDLLLPHKQVFQPVKTGFPVVVRNKRPETRSMRITHRNSAIKTLIINLTQSFLWMNQLPRPNQLRSLPRKQCRRRRRVVAKPQSLALMWTIVLLGRAIDPQSLLSVMQP